MKFFHIGDLHFGKMFFNLSLTETDQTYWTERFLEAVDDYQPDAVVIAGDVYDRKIPSPEAMQLFDRLITGLAERGKYVFVIPGNHDSAIRLSHVSSLLKTHHIYIAGNVSREMQHITLGNVTFWLMPYIFPKAVSDAAVLDRDDITSYEEAARALIEAQSIDTSQCNILVAHQNVLAAGTAPEHSESETIIGGLGEIDFSVFDPFDYVALGHIHNAQKIGRETVRYAGCPMYYDFSEINRNKDLTLVTVRSKSDIQVEKVEIKLRHQLLQLTGTLEELIDKGLHMQDKENYYIQCVLCDKSRPPHIMERLREVFGDNLVNVKILREENNPSFRMAETVNPSDHEAKQELDEQFLQFYQSLEHEVIDSEQEELIRRIMEQQERRSGEYYPDDKYVPESDSQELIDFLLNGKDSKEDAV